MVEKVGEEVAVVTRLDAVIVVDWVVTVEDTVLEVVDGKLVLVNTVLDGVLVLVATVPLL